MRSGSHAWRCVRGAAARPLLRVALRCCIAVAAAAAMGCRADLEPVAEPLLVFPPPPAEPRIQYLTWASGAGQVEGPIGWFDDLLLGPEAETGADTIVKPYGIAAREGVVYVCDTKASSLARLDFARHTFTRLGISGVEKLRKPLNVAIDSLGYKFVVDSERRQVVVFGPDDHFVTALAVPEPCHPVDLAIHGEEVFVLDNDDDPQIVVLERTSGAVLRTFGGAGAGPGQFTKPSSLCIDGAGFIYVSDSFNYRIQKLSPDGAMVWERGAPGRRLGQFGRPRGIRIGPDGVLYLVEGAMQLVQMFDSDGNVLMRFGGPGNVPGGFVLPATLAIDATSVPYFADRVHPDFEVDYLLFVSNQYGAHLVNVYAFGSFPEGYRFQASEISALPELEDSTGIDPVEPGSETTPPGTGRAPHDLEGSATQGGGR